MLVKNPKILTQMLDIFKKNILIYFVKPKYFFMILLKIKLLQIVKFMKKLLRDY